MVFLLSRVAKIIYPGCSRLYGVNPGWSSDQILEGTEKVRYPARLIKPYLYDGVSKSIIYVY